MNVKCKASTVIERNKVWPLAIGVIIIERGIVPLAKRLETSGYHSELLDLMVSLATRKSYEICIYLCGWNHIVVYLKKCRALLAYENGKR